MPAYSTCAACGDHRSRRCWRDHDRQGAHLNATVAGLVKAVETSDIEARVGALERKASEWQIRLTLGSSGSRRDGPTTILFVWVEIRIDVGLDQRQSVCGPRQVLDDQHSQAAPVPKGEMGI
jgi:hypothetical protein